MTMEALFLPESVEYPLEKRNDEEKLLGAKPINV